MRCNSYLNQIVFTSQQILSTCRFNNFILVSIIVIFAHLQIFLVQNLKTVRRSIRLVLINVTSPGHRTFHHPKDVPFEPTHWKMST